jgi:hypothetical protein
VRVGRRPARGRRARREVGARRRERARPGVAVERPAAQALVARRDARAPGRRDLFRAALLQVAEAGAGQHGHFSPAEEWPVSGSPGRGERAL